MNCQKAQFRDDVPQLFQAGSHLEFDEAQAVWRDDRPWGIIPTEFEFVDSFPELPKLTKSCQDGCDFCCFLHGAITAEAPKWQNISNTSSQGLTISVTISYMWGLRQRDYEGNDFLKTFYIWPNGLSAMWITLEVLYDQINPGRIFILDYEVQSLYGEYSRSLSQHAYTKALTIPNR